MGSCMTISFSKIITLLGVLLVGRTMAVVVGHRLLSPKVRIQSQGSPCGNFGGRSVSGAGVSPRISVLPSQLSFTTVFHHLQFVLLAKHN
jgi:hypothetical protein